MPRGAAGKARRKERRKQERAAEKRAKAREGQGDPAGNFLSGMWNAMQMPWSTSAEGEVEGAETLKNAGLRKEVSSESGKSEGDAEEEEEGGSWLSGWLPSFKWEDEAEASGTGHREGDDDNHLDLLSGTAKRSASVEMGAEGVQAELAGEAGGSLLEMAGKKEGQVAGPLHGGVEGEMSMGSANASAKGGLDIGSSGVSAELEGELGAHLMKGGAKAKGALKLPWINAMMFGSAGVEGSLGYGAKAGGKVQADTEKGFSASGNLGASVGVGGGLSYGFGLEKADPDKGWFDSSADRTYEEGTAEDSSYMAEPRVVTYIRHEPEQADVAEVFVYIEAQVEGGIRHALLVPRTWDLVTRIPTDDDPEAPTLDSVAVEDPALGEQGAVLACGWVPASWAPDARGVVEKLAARDGYRVYRWNEEDAEGGGARAMASTETHLAALRVLPYGDRWAFFSAVGPKDRLGEYGGALQHGLLSFRLYPEWALDVD